jgi:hypothetical protein
MSEFHDPQFEHALGRLSGEFPDDNVALGAVYQRVQQVRRRRTIVASSTASVLLMVGIGVAAARGVHHESLQPSASISIPRTTVATADSTTSSAPVVPVSTKPAHPTTTIEAATTTQLIPVIVPPPRNTGGSQGPGQGGTPTTVPPVTTTHPAPSTTPTTPPTITAPTTAPTTAVPTTVAPGEVSSYYTPGGWFTVRFANGMLTLVDVHTEPGFAIDSQTVEAQRIEFRFRGQFGDYRTRVEVKHGQLQVSH